jgi:hypothetical protein
MLGFFYITELNDYHKKITDNVYTLIHQNFTTKSINTQVSSAILI